MSHNLLRLTNSIFSQPLLITKDACEDVLSYLDKRNSASLKDLNDIAKADFGGMFPDMSTASSTVEGVGVIEVSGPISTYKTGFEGLCQNTSYESIIEQATEFSKDDTIHTVLLSLKSGGGMAHKAFEQSAQLKKIVEGSGKKLVSYIDHLACSAAFVLASVASEVVINPSASAGSIGVLIELQNDNKAYEKEGIQRKWITSSSGKIPFDEEGEFREDFIEDLQANVSELYEDFVNHVVEYRGMDRDVVINTNAGVYTAKKALELNLVDKVMETQEFLDYLNEENMNKPNSIQPLEKETLMSTSTPVNMETYEAAMAELSAMKAEKLASDTSTKKAALLESLSSATYLSNVEGVADFLMSADKEASAMLQSILSDTSASLLKQASASESLAAEVETKHNASLTEAQAKSDVLAQEKEDLKAEFSKVDSVRGEEKEENLQALDHKEKLSRAVAAAQLKKQS